MTVREQTARSLRTQPEAATATECALDLGDSCEGTPRSRMWVEGSDRERTRPFTFSPTRTKFKTPGLLPAQEPGFPAIFRFPNICNPACSLQPHPREHSCQLDLRQNKKKNGRMGGRFSKFSCSCAINCNRPTLVHDHDGEVGQCPRCTQLRRGAESRASSASTSTEYLPRPRYYDSPSPERIHRKPHRPE